MPTSQEALLINLLKPMLGAIQNLEVYDEIGIPDPNLTTFRFGYEQWKDDRSPQVRKRDGNSNPSYLYSGLDFLTDSDAGAILLISGVTFSPGQEIRASYRFKYFSDDELAVFLNLTLYELNGWKPISGYTLEGVPLEWNYGLVLGAYIKCLQRILIDQGIWAKGLIWKDTEKWAAYLTTMLASAEKTYERYAKYLKRRALIRVYGISSGKFGTQQLVSESNFRQFTIISPS